MALLRTCSIAFPFRLVVLMGAVWGWVVGEGQGVTTPLPGLAVQTDRQAGRVEFRHGDKRLFVYTYGTNQFKPYVQELCTLQGENVLRDAPPDHAHHHGLMYAIRVNENNFWEESERPGYQRPAEPIQTKAGRTPEGLPSATVMQRIHWVPKESGGVRDTGPMALLVEMRTLTLTVNVASQEVALRWESEFEPGPGASKVTLAGSEYHGLGMRLPVSFDRVGRHLNSEQKPYKTPDQRDVLEARWSAVAGRMGERDVMIACFGRPSDQKGPLKFFTMLDPFAYLSATQGLDLAPQEFSAGQKWTLSHLVLVYSSHPTAEALERRYQVWEKVRR